MHMGMYVNVRNSETLPFSAYCHVLIFYNFFDIMEHAVPRKSRNIHLRSHFTRQLKTLLSQTCAIAQFSSFDTLPAFRKMWPYSSFDKYIGDTYLSLLHINLRPGISFRFKIIGNFECNKISNKPLFHESLRD